MPAKLDRCVTEVGSQIRAKWRKANPGKTMSEKQGKKTTSSAWAICRSTLKMESEEVNDNNELEDATN